MDDERQSEVTAVLGDLRAGKADAADRLVALVYAELRDLAAGIMRRERRDHTLQPTALLNEAFARLLTADLQGVARDRRVFFGAAVRAMRQVLVDHARRRAAAKRPDGKYRNPLIEAPDPAAGRNLTILAVHEGLEQLAALSERQARVVEMRFFGGFTVPEIAEMLDMSVSSVEADFRKASAFLRARLPGDLLP